MWIQACATVAAIAVATWSGWVALRGIQAQQEINTSQLALNHSMQERTLKRFASRVAIWVEIVAPSCPDFSPFLPLRSKCTARVHIDNRSSTSLTNVTLRHQSSMSPPPTRWRIVIIPPCSELTADIELAPKTIVTTQPTIDMTFDDPVGHWRIEPSKSVERIEDRRDDPYAYSEPIFPSHQAGAQNIQKLGDCGESA